MEITWTKIFVVAAITTLVVLWFVNKFAGGASNLFKPSTP